jgi:hypothetical protein
MKSDNLIQGEVEVFINGVKIEGLTKDMDLNVKEVQYKKLEENPIYKIEVELKVDEKSVQRLFDYLNNFLNRWNNFKAFVRSLLCFMNRLN